MTRRGLRTETRVVIGFGRSNVPLLWEKGNTETKMFDCRMSRCLRNVWGPGVFHEAHNESKDIDRIFAGWWRIILVQVVGEVIMPVILFLPGAFGEQKERRYKQFIF